ncbi:MAG: LuxR C-terminal-related transcriptional regulator, partial [Anaerolineae bacterium]|jgi:LuxR family maltose regulon positive regulatory protein
LIGQLNAGLLRQNDGFTRKLTLVSAPAGFGKTTLLSEWTTHCGHPVAWLSLDDGDNDPARFLVYLVAALQTVHREVGEAALAALQSPRPPSAKAVLTALINEAVAVSDHTILILDDYHLIRAQPVHDALTFLMDHQPPHLHLVVATRADPPIQVARLRARGQLTELRQSDLRFDAAEAATFLNSCAGLALSIEDAAALEARTEGWIAGLQMAALAMAGQGFESGPVDTAQFVRAFTGSDRHILDYLVEEVLQHQPSSIQDFLLQTSILDRMTGTLCDALLCGGVEMHPAPVDAAALDDPTPGPSASGQETLEYLERHNLFVVPLDGQRCWYRYHRLFADLLRHRLRRARPELLPVLHARATTWYEAHGLTETAIGHALSAGDFAQAAHLVDEAAEDTMLRGEFATFRAWAEALPEDVLRARPRLGIFQALAMVLDGQPLDLARSLLQGAAGADKDGSFAGEVVAFRALIASYQGARERSAQLSQQALELLSEDSLFFRSFVAGFMGLSHLYVGDIGPATQAFEEAVRVSRKTGNATIAVLARCHLAELSLLQGKTQAAQAWYEAAIAAASQDPGRHHPIAGVALIGLGRLALERFDLDLAESHLKQGIALAARWGEAGTITGYTGLARVRQAQGSEQAALEAAQKALTAARKFDAMEIDDIGAALCQTRLWIAQGNLEPVKRWVEERDLTYVLSSETLRQEIESAYSLYRFSEYIALARLLVAEGRPRDALALVEPLLHTAEDAGWVTYCAEALAVKALALQAQRQVEPAIAALERALCLGKPGGFVHLFVEKGQPMGDLLRTAASRGMMPEYTSELIAVLAASAYGRRSDAPAAPADQPLVEPLTEREVEVLRLLPTHLSSTEIAEELLISVHTARFHIKNIYAKLHVHNRADAVARAQRLGLLSR